MGFGGCCERDSGHRLSMATSLPHYRRRLFDTDGRFFQCKTPKRFEPTEKMLAEVAGDTFADGDVLLAKITRL